jgi:hypothetical protein
MEYPVAKSSSGHFMVVQNYFVIDLTAGWGIRGREGRGKRGGWD